MYYLRMNLVITNNVSLSTGYLCPNTIIKLLFKLLNSYTQEGFMEIL